MAGETLKLTILANFIAIGVALGYALAFLPNVELVTLVIFLSGYVLGWKSGLFVGFVTEFIYSNFNLYGPAPFHILIAQVLGMALAGASGGFCSMLVNAVHDKISTRVIFLIAGISVTMLFDFLTTAADVIIVNGDLAFFLARLFTGLPFFTAHIFINGFLFFVLLPALLKALNRMPIFRRLQKDIKI